MSKNIVTLALVVVCFIIAGAWMLDRANLTKVMYGEIARLEMKLAKGNEEIAALKMSLGSMNSWVKQLSEITSAQAKAEQEAQAAKEQQVIAKETKAMAQAEKVVMEKEREEAVRIQE